MTFSRRKLLFTISPQRPVSGTLTLTYGGFYGGTLKEMTWRGRVEFGPRFYAEPTISLNYFKTPFGDGDANIISSRLTYTLTPRMFASALVQYQSAQRSISTNARFRWEYQPGSELFVVYSDGRTPPARLSLSWTTAASSSSSRSCSGSDRRAYSSAMNGYL